MVEVAHMGRIQIRVRPNKDRCTSNPSMEVARRGRWGQGWTTGNRQVGDSTLQFAPNEQNLLCSATDKLVHGLSCFLSKQWISASP